LPAQVRIGCDAVYNSPIPDPVCRCRTPGIFFRSGSRPHKLNLCPMPAGSSGPNRSSCRWTKQRRSFKILPSAVAAARAPCALVSLAPVGYTCLLRSCRLWCVWAVSVLSAMRNPEEICRLSHCSVPGTWRARCVSCQRGGW